MYHISYFGDNSTLFLLDVVFSKAIQRSHKCVVCKMPLLMNCNNSSLWDNTTDLPYTQLVCVSKNE